MRNLKTVVQPFHCDSESGKPADIGKGLSHFQQAVQLATGGISCSTLKTCVQRVFFIQLQESDPVMKNKRKSFILKADHFVQNKAERRKTDSGGYQNTPPDGRLNIFYIHLQLTGFHL